MKDIHGEHHLQYSHDSHDSQYSHHSHYQNSVNEHPLVPAADAGRTGIKAKPSHDKVARKAYEIYLKEGCPQGRDVQHWLDAETQLST